MFFRYQEKAMTSRYYEHSQENAPVNGPIVVLLCREVPWMISSFPSAPFLRQAGVFECFDGVVCLCRVLKRRRRGLFPARIQEKKCNLERNKTRGRLGWDREDQKKKESSHSSEAKGLRIAKEYDSKLLVQGF